jgi:hypothetical protein
MLSGKIWQTIYQAYDYTQTATWAVLWAVVLYVPLFILPTTSQRRAEIESRRVLEISSENRLYCSKWGVREGSEKYLECALDLQQIRANAERRIDPDPYIR